MPARHHSSISKNFKMLSKVWPQGKLSSSSRFWICCTPLPGSILIIASLCIVPSQGIARAVLITQILTPWFKDFLCQASHKCFQWPQNVHESPSEMSSECNLIRSKPRDHSLDKRTLPRKFSCQHQLSAFQDLCRKVLHVLFTVLQRS